MIQRIEKDNVKEEEMIFMGIDPGVSGAIAVIADICPAKAPTS
jgi:predicted RNase H-like nuclease (RuvC/YqgF family)